MMTTGTLQPHSLLCGAAIRADEFCIGSKIRQGSGAYCHGSFPK
jgi:hypothetical protein